MPRAERSIDPTDPLTLDLVSCCKSRCLRAARLFRLALYLEADSAAVNDYLDPAAERNRIDISPNCECNFDPESALDFFIVVELESEPSKFLLCSPSFPNLPVVPVCKKLELEAVLAVELFILYYSIPANPNGSPNCKPNLRAAI